MKLLAAQQEQQTNALAQQNAQQNATFANLATQMLDSLLKHKKATASPTEIDKSNTLHKSNTPVQKGSRGRGSL